MKIKNEEQNEAFRQKILDTAQELIVKEGIEHLSIRKITNALQYTPGIIYHYFKNKDEILAAITMQGYQSILKIVMGASQSTNPEIRIRETLSAYIKGMLAQRDFFLIMMMSNDHVITSQVDLLKPGIRETRKSIDALCQLIEAGIAQQLFVCEDVETRAQVIWCATFGLIQRLQKEQVDEVQTDRLIQAHLDMILASLGGSV